MTHIISAFCLPICCVVYHLFVGSLVMLIVVVFESKKSLFDFVRHAGSCQNTQSPPTLHKTLRNHTLVTNIPVLGHVGDCSLNSLALGGVCVHLFDFVVRSLSRTHIYLAWFSITNNISLSCLEHFATTVVTSLISVLNNLSVTPENLLQASAFEHWRVSFAAN